MSQQIDSYLYSAPSSETQTDVQAQSGLAPYEYVESGTTSVVVSSALPQLALPIVTRNDTGVALVDGSNVTVDQGVLVLFSHVDDGVTLRYTLTSSGVEPTATSTIGTYATLDVNAVLKVKAFKAGYQASNSITIHFTVQPIYVATPVIAPVAGTYTSPIEIQITCADSADGAVIRYTTDGSLPITSSTLYSAPFSLPGTGNKTVRAAAFKAYRTTSYAQAVYTLQAPIMLAVEFTGTVPAIQNIRSVSATMRGFDQNTGNVSTDPSDQYFFSFVIKGAADNFEQSSTLNFQINDPDPAVLAGEMEREYTLKGRIVRGSTTVTTIAKNIIIDEKKPVTSSNKASGLYPGTSLSVQLTASDLPNTIVPPSAPVIYYTIDGTNPTVSSQVYSSPVLINDPGTGNTITLKYISKDAAGNIESPNWTLGENTRIFSFDNAAPQVTVDNISKTVLHVGDSATITWHTNEHCKRWVAELGGSGIIGTGTSLGGAYVSIAANASQSFVIGADQIPSGEHEIYLFAVDDADKIGYTTLQLTLDNQVPIITVHEICRHTMATHDTAIIVWTTSVSGTYDIRRGGLNPGDGFEIASGNVVAGEIVETPVTENQLHHNISNSVRIYVTTVGGTVGASTQYMTVDSQAPTTNISPRGSDGPFNNPIIATITASDYVVPGVSIDASDADEEIAYSETIIPTIQPNSMFAGSVFNFNTAAGEQVVLDGMQYVASDATTTQAGMGLGFYQYNESAIAQTSIASAAQLAIPIITRSDTNAILADGATVGVNQGLLVLFSHTEPGVTLRYTLTTGGVEPTATSTIGTYATLDVNAILKVKAFKSGFSPSPTITINFNVTPIYVATPVILPASGAYNPPLEVSITCSDTSDGAVIRYTTDNTTPTASSTLYSSPFSLTGIGAKTVKAAAFKAYRTTSYAQQAYTLQLPSLVMPTVTRTDTNVVIADGANVNVNQGVTILFSHPDPNVTLRYTLTSSGVEPTATSAIGTYATLDVNAVLKVKAYRDGYEPSPTITVTFTVTPIYVEAPVILPASGTFEGAVSVSISCATDGATIKYTTNGSAPTVGSTTYTAPFNVTQTSTVKAMAFKAFMTASYAEPRDYTINAPTLHRPVVTNSETNQVIPDGTTVTVAQGLTILFTHDDPDATLRYTLTTDGVEPTATSSAGTYATLDVNVVLKVKAFKAGINPSDTVTIRFIVTPVYVEQPRFSPNPGNFLDEVNVVITSQTPGAIINYTIDGTPATPISPVYQAGTPIHITQTTTINAIARKPYMTTSSNSGAFNIIVAVPPAVSNLVVHPYRTTCVIRWTTDVPCTGRVDYGLTSTYNLSNSEYGSGFKLQHQVLLTGLTPDRVYHFALSGQDENGIPLRIVDEVFVTRANRDTRIAIYATNDGTDPTTSNFTNRAIGQQLSININYNTVLKYFAVDGFGNEQGIQTEVYSLDAQPPLITVASLTPAVIGVDGIATLRFKVNEPAKYKVINQENSVLATNESSSDLLAADVWFDAQLHAGDMVEGFNHITIIAKDVYGNTASVLVGHVIRDTIPPEIEPSKQPGYYNDDIYVSLVPKNLRDGEKIVIYYTVDGNLPDVNSRRSGVGENQVYNIRISETTTIRWYSIDEVGNEELKKYATYIIDRKRPSIEAIPPAGIYDDVIDVRLQSDEPATIYYTLNGTIPTDSGSDANTYIYVATKPIEIIQDSVITCFAKDLAGNVSDVRTFTYEIKALRGRKFKKVIGFQDKILLETEFNEAQDLINRRLEELALEVVGSKCIISGFDVLKTYAANSFEFYVQRGKAYINGKFVTVHRNDMCQITSVPSNESKAYHLILKPSETIFKPTRPGHPGWEEGVPEITTYRLEENYILDIVEELPPQDDPYIELYTITKPATASSIQDCVFVDKRDQYKFAQLVDFQKKTQSSLDSIEANLLALGLEVESYKLRNLLGLKNAFVDTFETTKDIDATKSGNYRYVNTRFEL